MAMERRVFSEELRRHIVEEIESGRLSIADAAQEYRAYRSVVKGWLKEYGKFRPERSVVEVVMKSEKDRIGELEKALAEAHLKIRLYDEIMKQAGKKYHVDLKKTFGSERLDSSSEKDSRSKRFAKRSG